MKSVIVAMMVAFCSGCQSNQADPVPAHLVSPTATVRQELQQAIQQAIGGTPVTLADNVLTQTNKLYIGQQVLRDAQGHPIMGRHHQPTHVFQLWLEGNQCVLRHPASGKAFTLTNAQCAPMEK